MTPALFFRILRFANFLRFLQTPWWARRRRTSYIHRSALICSMSSAPYSTEVELLVAATLLPFSFLSFSKNTFLTLLTSLIWLFYTRLLLLCFRKASFIVRSRVSNDFFFNLVNKRRQFRFQSVIFYYQHTSKLCNQIKLYCDFTETLNSYQHYIFV